MMVQYPYNRLDLVNLCDFRFRGIIVQGEKGQEIESASKVIA